MEFQTIRIRSSLHDFQPTELGEGPFWDPETGRLGLVDLLRGRLMIIDENGTTELDISVDGELSLAIPIDGNASAWLVASGNRVGVLTAEGEFTLVAETSTDSSVRLNDGKCDSRGRLWVGSMSRDNEPGRGALYRIDASGALSTMVSGLTLSNGMGWSPDGRTFYLIDTIPGELLAWDFDERAGSISNRRVLVRDMSPGVPDGLDIDENGDLWIAMCGGGMVKQFSGAGVWLADHPTPVTMPTCPVFGGGDRRSLFVTSATITLSDDQLLAEPAGAVLVSRSLAPGLAAHRAVLEARHLGGN